MVRVVCGRGVYSTVELYGGILQGTLQPSNPRGTIQLSNDVISRPHPYLLTPTCTLTLQLGNVAVLAYLLYLLYLPICVFAHSQYLLVPPASGYQLHIRDCVLMCLSAGVARVGS